MKFAPFDAGLAPILRGEVEDIETSPHLRARDTAKNSLADQCWPAGTDFATILHDLLDFTRHHAGSDALAGVGHRIVHGGADHVEPALVTAALMAQLEGLTPLDPLHMPHNLAPVRTIAVSQPDLPQIACFDTAFHHAMPAEAQAVAVPRALRDEDVRRYGFHGLSYEYIAGELVPVAPELASGRVVVAHLGAGASLCALKSGVSIATTMGFSTLDGLVMATRCGSIDPGVILYLARRGHSIAEIEDMLYHQSGLLGISGISGNMRVLLDSTDTRAAEAIALFTYRVAIEVAGMACAMGGIDGLVFTAGIGQHAPEIRAAVCNRLAWLGIKVDALANAAGATCISTPDSKVAVLMIPTDEEVVIARHTQALLT